MLTREKFQNLNNIKSMPCLSCEIYYGLRDNLYLCSKCCNQQNSEIKDIKFYREYVLSKKNFEIFPNISVKMISSILNNINNVNFQEIGLSTHGEYVFNVIKSVRDCINEKNEEYINYILSDEQGFELINKINWNEFNKGYLICHAIVRNRISPWSDYKNKFYDQSSFCYFGNFLELPKDEKHVDKILNYNLNEGFINNF